MKHYLISAICPYCFTSMPLKNQKIPRYKKCPNCKERITFKNIRMKILKGDLELL